jgi:hypothetical protein
MGTRGRRAPAGPVPKPLRVPQMASPFLATAASSVRKTRRPRDEDARTPGHQSLRVAGKVGTRTRNCCAGTKAGSGLLRASQGGLSPQGRGKALRVARAGSPSGYLNPRPRSPTLLLRPHPRYRTLLPRRASPCSVPRGPTVLSCAASPSRVPRPRPHSPAFGPHPGTPTLLLRGASLF